MELFPTLVIAAVMAFLIGRFSERAHDAHSQFNAYRHRINSQLAAWAKGSMLALAWTVGLLVLATVVLR
jgi:hypothetical protein